MVYQSNRTNDTNDIFTIDRPRLVFMQPTVSKFQTENQEFIWYHKKRRELETKWTFLLIVSILISILLSIILLGVCFKYGPIILNVASWSSSLIRNLKLAERKIEENKFWNESWFNRSTIPRECRNFSNIHHASLPSKHEHVDRICSTVECVRRANSILDNLDEKINPCEDFYQFSCGNWIHRNPVPAWADSTSMFEKVHSKAINQLLRILEKKSNASDIRLANLTRSYYKMCMDEDLINKTSDADLHEIIEKIGDWPMASNNLNWSSNDYDWINTTIKLRWMGISSHTLLKIQPIVDVHNNTIYRIGIQEPSLMIGRDYVIQNGSVIQSYLKFMKKVASLYNGLNKNMDEEALQVLKFQQQLALLTSPKEERVSATLSHLRMTIAELNALAPSIPWNKFLNGLFGVELSDKQIVLVKNSGGFLTKLEMLISKTDKRVIANHVAWGVVHSLLPYLGPKWDKLEGNFWNLVLNKTGSSPRWSKCLNGVKTFMGLPLQSIYAQTYHSIEVKEKVTQIARQVEFAFNETLEEADWMDESTKKAALDKLNHLSMIIAYPDKILDPKLISEMYKSLPFNESSNYIQNTLRMSLWYLDFIMNRFDQPNERNDWTMSVRISDTNAYYSFLDNSLFLPIGLLVPDIFTLNLPHYLNFGSIGFVAGHEITHAFDNNGRRFDSFGNSVNWWSNSSESYFIDHAFCIEQQYSNYTLMNGLNLDGIFSLGENIADNGGLHVAFQAYKSMKESIEAEPRMPGLKYSPDQLFWISFAQMWCSNYRNETLEIITKSNPHVPGRFRVIGSVTNNVDFAQSFNCPSGSPMNPKNKCILW